MSFAFTPPPAADRPVTTPPHNTSRQKRREAPGLEERDAKRRLVEQLEILSLDRPRSVSDGNDTKPTISPPNVPQALSHAAGLPCGDFMDTGSEHVVFIPSIDEYLSNNPDDEDNDGKDDNDALNRNNGLVLITDSMKPSNGKNRNILPFSLLVTEDDHRANNYHRSKGLSLDDINNRAIYDKADWYKQMVVYEGGPYEIVYKRYMRWWLHNQIMADRELQDPYEYPHRPPSRDIFTFSRPPSRLWISTKGGDVSMTDDMVPSMSGSVSPATSTRVGSPVSVFPQKLFTEFTAAASGDTDVDMD